MDFLQSLIDMVAEMAPYLLLGFLVAGLLYAFVPSGFYRRHLSRPGIGAVLKAALIGVPLPLCSCGVLPTAVSLRKNGASRGASTSFLIATPQTGVDSIAATYSLLGPAYAIIRPVAALLTAVVGGLIVTRGERRDGSACVEDVDTIDAPAYASLGARLAGAFRFGFVDMVQNIGKWLVIGLVVAAAITVFVPDGFFTFFADYPLLAMLAVIVVAVPMYVCSTGSIPIALALMMKGLSPGAAFVLLMAGPAANFASLLIVNKSLGRRAAVAYLSTIVAGSILVGLSIDYLMPARWFAAPIAKAVCCDHHAPGILPTVCSIVLILLIANAFILKYRKPKHKHEMEKQHTTVIVKGMTCGHCKALVEKHLSKLEGVTGVSVDLSTGETVIEGTPDPAAVRQVIDDLNFTLA